MESLFQVSGCLVAYEAAVRYFELQTEQSVAKRTPNPRTAPPAKMPAVSAPPPAQVVPVQSTQPPVQRTQSPVQTTRSSELSNPSSPALAPARSSHLTISNSSIAEIERLYADPDCAPVKVTAARSGNQSVQVTFGDRKTAANAILTLKKHGKPFVVLPCPYPQECIFCS